MEEDIKILEHFINNAGIEVTTFELKGAIKNLINKYKEQEKMIKLMSRTMHYICLFRSQSKYVIRKYCKIYNSGNIGECEGLICSECVANYFRKKAKGE